MRRLKFTILMLIVLLSGLATQTRAAVSIGLSRESVNQAVVHIIAGEFDSNKVFQRKSSASGVIVSADGYVLTAHHAVFTGANLNELYSEIWAVLVNPRQDYLLPNRAVKLRFVAADQASDLALFQIQSATLRKSPPRYPFLRLASNLDLAYGDTLRVIGYPNAYAPYTANLTVGVVELDEISDWIKVEGDLLQGISGGAVINAHGELVGIPIRVMRQIVSLFNDNNVPVGQIELEKVGMLRSADAIARFLSEALKAKFPPSVNKGFNLNALIVDERTKQPIKGATIGVLMPETVAPEFYITADELLSYGRSNEKGECVLSRRLPAGRYLVKVVHPDYETEIAEVNLSSNTERLLIKMRLAF